MSGGSVGQGWSRSVWERAARWAVALSVVVGLGVGSAEAQDAKVLELNRDAMTDYQNLEFGRAVEKLEKALSVAKSTGVKGAALARTYINLGVVHVAGLADNARGLDAFEKALAEDASIKLDPLTSTPEVQTVYNLARKKRGEGATFEGNMPHVPPAGQRPSTPLPIFVEVPPEAPVDRVTVFYRSLGATEYEKLRLEPVEGGFGVELPCEAVTSPLIEYFLVAYDKKGKALGYAGKTDRPIQVPVVQDLSAPPPALPGREPPKACVDAECPPGMPGCPEEAQSESDGRGEGESCVEDAECASGLVCVDDVCEPEADPEVGSPPRFFAHLGGTFGAAYVTDGMPADSAPVGSGMSTTHIPATDPECNLDNADEYCVRIQTPGFVPTYALRMTVGYYVLERLAFALTWRFQPSAGEGTLSNMLFGLRGQFLLTAPREEGLSLAGFLGTSYGQIQPQPDQPTSDKAPYVRTGLNGVQLGSVLVYRFSKHLGIHFTPEVHVLLPLFLFNIDLTAGLEIGF